MIDYDKRGGSQGNPRRHGIQRAFPLASAIIIAYLQHLVLFFLKKNQEENPHKKTNEFCLMECKSSLRLISISPLLLPFSAPFAWSFKAVVEIIR
jgi:hypothetical protein